MKLMSGDPKFFFLVPSYTNLSKSNFYLSISSQSHLACSDLDPTSMPAKHCVCVCAGTNINLSDNCDVALNKAQWHK